MKHVERFRASTAEESRYRLLVDAVTDYAIYMLDPEGVVSSWNAGAERIKGYREHEIVGQHFSQFYTEEDRTAGRPALTLRTATEAGRFAGEGWRVRKDGSRFWASVVVDPILDPAGRLIGFAKITRDLSERRHADAALRASEERFRLLVQSVTDYAIFMLDAEGRVTNWNSGAERIKGYTPEDIVGRHFSCFYTPEDRARGAADAALAAAAREGRFEKEGWRMRKDGSRFWAHVVIDRILSEDGTLIGFAKVTRDITERRESQRALEKAREAFFQAQKMEAIGQLTGGVAHDFNNLLTAILGSLDLLRKRLPEEPRTSRLLDNAILAAQRGASLTQRMLAFARRQDLAPEPVDVPLLVRGMTGLLERTLGPNVAIETRFPLGLGAAEADANQLELALLNLAVNARDAMPQGGTIIIAARQVAVREPVHATGLPEGDYMCLSVADTGEGMDEATLARAAEPFFTTKGVGKGTGLGLSMVHGMAEQSGGRLILKSRRGEGTTAEIWLPLAAAPRPAGTAPASEAEAEPSLGHLAVLAVDDDAIVLANTAALLEDLGCTVHQAASGAEALAVLEAGTPVDLVITDQAMPRMTGMELAAVLRTRWPALPIVLATGYADLPAGELRLPRLPKPFSQQDLARMVREVAAQPPGSGTEPPAVR
ncbi:hybrid sensor histidine kinase/response regulator [Prosthecomicrobium pneumaticum]|uniref:histidine kinase n=1 Tax=Prosthecomicrobium pneumaticum TaxID=81895 RepID=A0A7W9L3V3_9HYPH|nr:PAS domain-containing sensor histidine kinase [Prosthecomicrobium pneumaticum]MBB5754929.1 PAS domain S-box-containing protein [Prosthecomicrobium pneumaticum]